MKPSKYRKKRINHVAIIMDGNGRWASKKKIAKRKGHEAGIINCINICKNINRLDYNINEISFYVFSTENWKRSIFEVSNLLSLIEKFYNDFKEEAKESNMRIRHYGSREGISKNILRIIDDVVRETKKNRGTYINLLFNYGSRKEIEDAIKKIRITKKKR